MEAAVVVLLGVVAAAVTGALVTAIGWTMKQTYLLAQEVATVQSMGEDHEKWLKHHEQRLQKLELRETDAR